MKPWPCGTSRAVICSQISCTSSALGLTRSNFEFHSHWFQLGAGRLSCQEPCQGPHLGAMDHLYFPTSKPFSRASLGDLAPITTSACMEQNWYSVKEITNPLYEKGTDYYYPMPSTDKGLSPWGNVSQMSHILRPLSAVCSYHLYCHLLPHFPLKQPPFSKFILKV